MATVAMSEGLELPLPVDKNDVRGDALLLQLLGSLDALPCACT